MSGCWFVAGHIGKFTDRVKILRFDLKGDEEVNSPDLRNQITTRVTSDRKGAVV